MTINSTSRRSFLQRLGQTALLAASGATWIPAARAQSPGPVSLRFAVASDGHFGQPETDYQRFHREMIDWLNVEVQGKGLDFVIFNGDLIHDDPVFLPQVKEAYDRLEVPYYTVRGNHDMVSPETWKITWGYDLNHAFEKGPYAFLLGSTANEKGEYLCADAGWLSGQLQERREKRWIFVFLHISQNGITRHGVTCPEIGSLLQGTSNVAAVFHGHDHDQDNVILQEKRAYFFDGHLGGSWGTNYRGYRIVEVSAEGQVLTYQCNPAAFHVNSTRIDS